MPDQTPTGDLLTVCENAFPSSQGGYTPVASFQSQTNALPANYSGGGAFIATDGTTTLLVGTDGGIYKLSTAAWVSLTASGVGRWRFVQFKNFAIGVNGSNTQVVDLLAGTGAALAAAPTGTSIAKIS